MAALLLVVAAAALPTPAEAHLWLRSSQPADGAQLDTVPREITLRFSEPVELALTRLEVLGPDGSPVRLARPSVSPEEPNVLVARIEGTIVPGPHTIVWRTTAADGHPVNGRIGFTVDEDAEGLVEEITEEPPPAVAPVHHDPAIFPEGDGFTAESPGFVIVRWLTFVGLLGVIGIVAFKLLVLGPVRRRLHDTPALLRPATARSADFGLAFSVLLVVAVLARLYAQSAAVHGAEEALRWASISALLTGTTWGTGWILQAAATIVALLGFAIARQRAARAARDAAAPRDARHRAEAARVGGAPVSGAAHGHGGLARDSSVRVVEPGAPEAPGGNGRADTSHLNLGWLLAAVGVVVLAFTPAFAGHAIATPERTWLAVLSDGLHVLGAGGWLGGLLAVVAIGVPVALRSSKGERGRTVAALVNAFSPTALFFAALVTVTGVLSATFHLASVSDLWQSDYGRTLLLKLGVLSLLFATGAYNWLRVRPALRDEKGAHRLRRSAGIELAVGVVVLLVTAVLVATPPPMDFDDDDAHAVASDLRQAEPYL